MLALAPYVSVTQAKINGVNGPNVVFAGVNVQIRSAVAENDTSGRGNLIVGWDTPLPTLPAIWRSGSNNLVVGELNNFTSYGCFVAGAINEVSGPYASVSGGEINSSTAAGTPA